MLASAPRGSTPSTTRPLGNTGTAQLRLGLDFQPNERFLLSASFGGIAFGRPGETEAYGTFFQLGLGLVF